MKISRAAMLVGLAIPLASILYFAADLVIVNRVPDQADWKAAAEVIRGRWKEGDLVVFSPQWAQGASAWLQGLNVDTGENPDWYEASRSERVWVLASMNGRREAPPEGWTVIFSRDLHKVSVDLWKPPAGPRPVFSFRDHIGDALVSRLHGQRREICSNQRNGRWYCGREHPWQFVGQDSKDVAGRVRDIIWAHAIDKAVVEAAWPAVPAGRTLTVHYGLTQRAAESREGSPVKVRILRNNVTVFEDVLAPDSWGWFRKDITLDPASTTDIRIQISAKDPQSRQFTFSADVWR